MTPLTDSGKRFRLSAKASQQKNRIKGENLQDKNYCPQTVNATQRKHCMK
jgi:hypothetical protein